MFSNDTASKQHHIAERNGRAASATNNQAATQNELDRQAASVRTDKVRQLTKLRGSNLLLFQPRLHLSQFPGALLLFLPLHLAHVHLEEEGRNKDESGPAGRPKRNDEQWEDERVRGRKGPALREEINSKSKHEFNGVRTKPDTNWAAARDNKRRGKESPNPVFHFRQLTSSTAH
jgi:hypothetical protein